jgi:Holliday junction resolvase RusA-like endonuclease
MTTIEIPIPPSANHLWRVVHKNRNSRCGKKKIVVRTKQYRSFLKQVIPLIRIGIIVQTAPVKVVITIRGGKGWSTKRDIGNCEKATLDALVHALRIPDDSCSNVVHEELIYLRPLPGQKARCWLSIQEVDPDDYVGEPD